MRDFTEFKVLSKIEMNISTLILMIVFINGVFSIHSDEEIRKECWNHYKSLQLCIPKYDKCIISMEDYCIDKLINCTEDGSLNELSNFCSSFFTNQTISFHNEEMYSMELMNKEFSSFGKKDSQRCNLSDFEYHNTDISKHAIRMIEILRSIILTFCQCSKTNVETYESVEPFSLYQSQARNFPIHFWYGGLRNYKCWKEVDRYLVFTLCGENTSLIINHEWAKLYDCKEDPSQFNCIPSFFNNLKATSRKSEKPLFCSIYIEIIKAFSISIENRSFDYKIVYMNTNASVNYHDDELYLFEPTNDEIARKCFPIKRTLNSCELQFNRYCSQKDCDRSLIICFEENKSISSECINNIVQRENIEHAKNGFFNFIVEHKWAFLISLSLLTILLIFKKLRDLLLKWILRSSLEGLTKLFDNSKGYFDGIIIAQNIAESEVVTENTNITDGRNNENMISFEGESLLPPCEQEDNQQPVIRLEKTPVMNNQGEDTTNVQNNNEISNIAKKETPIEPKEKRTLWKVFTGMWSSFWGMTCSFSKFVKIFAANNVYNSVVKYFTSPRNADHCPV